MGSQRGWLEPLIRPSPQVRDPDGRHEARFLALLHVVLMPSAVAAIVLQATTNADYIPTALALLPLVALMSVSYLLARTHHFHYGAWLWLTLGTAMVVTTVLGDPGNPALYTCFLAIPMMSGALFTSRLATVWTATIVVAATVLAILQRESLGHSVALTVILLILVGGTLTETVTRHLKIVTIARRAQQQSRDQRQNTLLEAAFGGMAIVASGRVIEASRGFAAMFGYTPKAILKRRVDRLLAPTEGAQTGQREGIHRGGHIFPIEWVVQHYEEEGEPRQVVAVRDLTERREMQAQLHQADRMATMGQLAAGVAHEINNPLSWVLGNLDLLAESLQGDDLDVVVRAAEGARRVERIVQDLRTFSRTHPAEPKAVDLHRSVTSAVNMVRHQLRDRCQLVEDYQPVPTIDGDETRVGQVCLNLLVNAIDALPPGRKDENLVKVRLFTDENGEAVIEVHDNGPGIDASVRHRMFDPFFTTKTHGTGLGLSITRAITDALGGRLEVDSNTTGTRMSVVLPAGLLAIEPAPVTANREPETASNNVRVLFVDDEPDICGLAVAALSMHDVRTAESANEALQLLETDLFDAILCDLMMPEKTGMDLYDEATTRWPELANRFAFVTGGAYTTQARSFIDKVQAPVLNKPFKLRDLRELVQRLKDGRFATQEPKPTPGPDSVG